MVVKGREGSEEERWDWGISILGFRVHTTCGGKEEGREQGGAKGVKGAKGSKGGGKGVKGSKGSKGISILGFRVPTTYGDKKFDEHI